MAYLNKVILIGNLTRDPESRATPKSSVCNFSLAVNRQHHAENGQTQEEVTYVDFEAWGKIGEMVQKYLRKGSSCLAEGRLKLDSWEDKASGQKRTKLKVILENVQFLSPPRVGQDAPAPAQEPAPARSAPPKVPHQDSDVPF
jgi:single-strand DNA-binding protein